MSFQINWIDRGFEPRMLSDPRYPTGIDLDVSNGAPATCKTTLPYPAKRCGFYVVVCEQCGTDAIVTTAGRPDDPRSVKLACKK